MKIGLFTLFYRDCTIFTPDLYAQAEQQLTCVDWFFLQYYYTNRDIININKNVHI